MKLPLLLALSLVPTLISHADPLADDAFARIVAPGARVETLAKGFRFTEGPVWNSRGFWIFSDIPTSSLFRVTPAGRTALVRKPTGSTNGNAYDGSERLISCEQSTHRIARKNAFGVFETLVDRFEGKRLNSPNDLALGSDGSIYFTDPTYGVSQAQQELGFRGLYRLYPAGKLELLDKEWEQPNGIAFSPDQKTLYVGDTEASKVFRYDVDSQGGLANKTLLTTVPRPDGLKVDSQGRVLVTGTGGVWIYAPRGGLLGRIPLPKTPTNLAFGGLDGKSLVITAGDSVYRVRLRVKSR